MKNKQRGFIVPLLITLGVLVIAGGIGYVILKNKTTANNTESVTNTKSNNENYPSYSNKAFAVNYPKGWTIDEYQVSTSPSSCNALGTYFVSNPVSKATLISVDKDYLHYLENPGSVIAVKGGLAVGKLNFDALKNVVMQYNDKLIKLTFYDQEMRIIDKKTDFNSKTPSVTYYYELPKYNKKGIAKLVVVDGKPSPVLLRIDYVAPAADYSVDLFTEVSSSLHNNITESSCF